MKKALSIEVPDSNDELRLSFRLTPNIYERNSFRIMNYDADSLRFIKVLGAGSSGTVSLCENIETHTYVAVKRIILGMKENRDQLQKEERCLSSFQDEHAVKQYGYYIKDNTANIVLEYMDCGSLNSHYSPGHPVPDLVLRCIGYQLVKVLISMRLKGIIHRDIKPANILLSSDGSVKLSDFGISKVGEDTTNSYVGTLRYMSPERLTTESYSYDCDYWSTAMVLLEAALGQYPLATASQFELVSSIVEKDFVASLEGLNTEFAAFIQLWLRKKKRVIPQPMTAHSWLKYNGKGIDEAFSRQIISKWLKCSDV